MPVLKSIDLMIAGSCIRSFSRSGYATRIGAHSSGGGGFTGEGIARSLWGSSLSGREALMAKHLLVCYIALYLLLSIGGCGENGGPLSERIIGEWKCISGKITKAEPPLGRLFVVGNPEWTLNFYSERRFRVILESEVLMRMDEQGTVYTTRSDIKIIIRGDCEILEDCITLYPQGSDVFASDEYLVLVKDFLAIKTAEWQNMWTCTLNASIDGDKLWLGNADFGDTWWEEV